MLISHSRDDKMSSLCKNPSLTKDLSELCAKKNNLKFLNSPMKSEKGDSKRCNDTMIKSIGIKSEKDCSNCGIPFTLSDKFCS